uniref:Uncharacterized protein n=1 Tax=Setaria digitata TaxID=48799 RepID=A0A915Q690_9BILA
MARTNVYSEVTKLNIRLAVRQVVTEFCARPERTVESIVNTQFENLTEPIHRLIAARLERIYGQLQYSILLPSNEPPTSRSVLRFLSGHKDESEKEIVQRFDYTPRKQLREEWQKCGIPSQAPTHAASPALNAPSLENLTSGRSSNSTSDKYHLIKNGQKLKSSPSSKSTSSNKSSESNDWYLSCSDALSHQNQEKDYNGQKLVSYDKKTHIKLSTNFIERSPRSKQNDKRANVTDKILVEIRKAADDALPVVLEDEFVPSVPSLEEVKLKMPNSLCSSLRSDDDKETVRFIPAKPSTVSVAVSTDAVFMNKQEVEKIEAGVNTVIEMGSNLADGSSSSNTASDNSAGQLPKRLFDTVMKRPSLKIVSLRPDGSIVPKDSSVSHNFPSVREWMPIVDEGNAEKSFVDSGEKVSDVAEETDLSHSTCSEKGGLDSASALQSRPDPFEEDLNTLANVSPLPHS